MKQIIQKYSAALVLLVALCIILLVNIATAEETPKAVLFFGRFHPLLLHLPIGALLLTFFLDVIGRIKKDYPTLIIRWALGFSSFFAIVTCILGYFLSLEGGYGSDILDIHFWTGILTAFLVSLLFIVASLNSKKVKKRVLPLFIITLISISVTGHYGSVLTHGENFLTQYIGAQEKQRTIEVVDSLRIYKDVISKILEDKCIQCHNTTKRKGELSLISKEDVLKGGENGNAMVIGNSMESLLYKQLLLPISDENHMPPEGKPQLTKDEIWLLKYWIDDGAKFKDYVGNTLHKDTLHKVLKKYLVFNEVVIPRASKNAIIVAEGVGFMIHELVPGDSKLSVKFTKKEITKKDVNTLSDLKEQIVELDFSNTDLNDEITGVLERMKNLKMLRLDNTAITDNTLQNIKNLEGLEVLNLFNTSITDTGLSELLKSITPKQIYTWNTKINKETAIGLQKTYNIQIHNGIEEGFIEESQLEMPIITPEASLFLDSISLRLHSNFKDVTLRYTLDGSDPDSTSTIFANDISLFNSKVVKVRAFKKGWGASDVFERSYSKVNHIVTNYTIRDKPEQRYPNANKLFDLEEGSISFKDGKWTAYLGYNVNTTINLGAVKTVDNISINCLEKIQDWILFPTKFKVYASNKEYTGFRKIGELKIKQASGYRDEQIKRYTLNIPSTNAQFFKIVIENPKFLPSWHEGAGKASWIFVDEIFLW